MKKKPMLVGITGGIGSGKSTICKIFEAFGVKHYNADERSQWIMCHNEKVREKLVKCLGEESFSNGKINKSFIGKKIFSDKHLLTKINAIVHPEVAQDFENWVNKNSQEKYMLKEAALLFESGSYRLLDWNILIQAPQHLRIQRVLLRDQNKTEKDIMKIIQNQWPDEKKEQFADCIIVNDEHKLLIPRLLELHDQLLCKSKKS